MADAVELKLTGLDGVLDMLKALPPEVVSKRGGPVKTALRKGALVIQRQAKANLVAVTNNQAEGEEKTSTGLLAANLVVTRGKPPIGGNGERYLVRVRRKSYQRKGKSTTTQLNGARLEYGTSEQPAEPWLRPAFAAKAEEAIRTVETELLNQIDRIVKRLAKRGG